MTVGWGENASAVAAAVGRLVFPPKTFAAEVIALGTTGAHGTVLKGRNLARFNLTETGSSPCSRHADTAACGADNVTDGGCVWCDVVDRPAFCTTGTAARQHHHPPDPPFQCDWAREK